MTTEEPEAEPHPIDFDALERGMVVPSEQIERVYGHFYGTMKYAFDVMTLKKMIQDHFRDVKNDTVSVVETRGSLRILSHKEQDEYVQTDKGRAVARFIRRHREDLGTDERFLTEEAKAARDKRLLLDSWKVQQLRKRKPPMLKK